MRFIRTFGKDGIGCEIGLLIERNPWGPWRSAWIRCLPPHTDKECAVFGFGLRIIGVALGIFRKTRVVDRI